MGEKLKEIFKPLKTDFDITGSNKGGISFFLKARIDRQCKKV
jgi:hypothetical protein